MDCIVEELSLALRQVGYEPIPIHITSVLPSMVGKMDAGGSLFSKIELANSVRSDTGDNAILATVAMLEIKRERGERNRQDNVTPLNDKISITEIPRPKAAYIIRQLKRDEEISRLRYVYGDSFIQVSVAVDEAKQMHNVTTYVSRMEPRLNGSDRESKARELIATDKMELSNEAGQRMLDAYQSADFFVAGNTRDEISRGLVRFVKAIFGSNHVSPHKEEFGAMMAKTASLRSVDLSRQVGAAIVNSSGDIISLGCNEVPSAGGGQYWGDDARPARDIEVGVDSNKIETSGIIDGFVNLLKDCNVLVEGYEEKMKNSDFSSGLKKLAISDLTEFGRITHAEMSAITEAARLGRSLSGATMIVTTFPCHNCAKHIVASGISRVVYIEPYAKSRALQMHQDSISSDSNVQGKVKIEHFMGISPRRFREIFEKKARKDKSTHKAETWCFGEPEPLLFEGTSFHTKREMNEIEKAYIKLKGCGFSIDASGD